MLPYMKKTIVLGALFMTIQPTISADLPDNRMYGIVLEKDTTEDQTQGINQTARELGQRIGSESLGQLPYLDPNGIVYPNISAFPYIIMKGKPGPLATLAGSSVDGVTQVSTPTTVALFGATSVLQPVTKKFSIYQPKAAVVPAFVPSVVNNLSDDGIASVVLVDQDLEHGKALNAMAHMSVGAGSAYTGDLSSLVFDWARTTSQNNIATFAGAVTDGAVTLVRFLDTMHLGPTYREQIAATLQRVPKVTGVYAIGAAAVLKKSLLLLK